MSAGVGALTSATAMRTATAGVERAYASASEAADAVSRDSDANPADLAQRAVQMLEARTQLRASAKVLTTADRMIGTLVDLRA